MAEPWRSAEGLGQPLVGRARGGWGTGTGEREAISFIVYMPFKKI